VSQKIGLRKGDAEALQFVVEAAWSARDMSAFLRACGLQAVHVTINQVCQRQLPHGYVMFRLRTIDSGSIPAFCAVADDGAAAGPVAASGRARLAREVRQLIALAVDPADVAGLAHQVWPLQ
jgi:hypothetical protein